MDAASLASELLTSTASEYTAQPRGPRIAYLEKLRLFVGIREVQSMDSGFMSLFISEITASARERQGGITITCVGMGDDMRAAVGQAVGQWMLGVLPVLAQWRGQHSCLSSPRELTARGGQFTCLAGPLVMRGQPEGETPSPASGDPFWPPLEPVVRARPLAQRVHWLELFASKSADGTVEATCRLNSRDWTAGRKVLESVASAWEASDEPLRTCRQFVLLVPKDGNAEEITPPGFWDRLLSRA
jgi:hypothetical protein